MKTKTKEKPFEITFTKAIPFDRVLDLLITGMEQGSTYWATVHGLWLGTKEGWLEKSIADGKLVVSNLQIEEAEGDADQEWDPKKQTGLKKTVINREALMKGLQLMSEWKANWHWNNFLDENDDAETGDVFVQFVVLGEVVYG